MKDNMYVRFREEIKNDRRQLVANNENCDRALAEYAEISLAQLMEISLTGDYRDHREFLGRKIAGDMILKRTTDIIKDEVRKAEQIYREFINALGNDGIIKNIENIQYFLYAIESAIRNEVLTKEEASQIFGNAISFMNSHKKPEDLKPYIVSLGNFYDSDGHYVKGGNLYTLIISFSQLVADGKDNKKLKEACAVAATDLIGVYQACLHEWEIEDEKRKQEDLKSEVVQSITPEMIVRSCYQDGEIVCLPDNYQEYMNALNEALISEDEKTLIKILLMEKYEGELYRDLLSESDQYVIRMARIYLGYKENKESCGLVKALESLDLVKSLYSENPEDVDDLISEKDEVIGRLSSVFGVLMHTHLENNLVFLTDDNAVPYFEQDLNNANRSTKRQAVALLSKINYDCRETFEEKAPYVYEIADKNVRIVFKDMGSGIYMVVGFTANPSSAKVLKRLQTPSNKLYIEDVENALVNYEERVKLLAQSDTLRVGFLNSAKLLRTK